MSKDTIKIGSNNYKIYKVVNYNNKSYVAYYDKENIYINEYFINEKNTIEFNEVAEENFSELKEVFGL